MTPINPSFGDRTYWHLVEGAPLDSAESAAAALLALVRHYDQDKELPSSVWPISRVVVRAMALELAVDAARSGLGLSNDVIELLAWSGSVPEIALTDPPAFYEGGWKGGAKPKSPEARVRASWLDRAYFQTTGKWMAVKGLERVLTEGFGDKAPPRDSLRRWRLEPDYRDFVVFRDGDASMGGET